MCVTVTKIYSGMTLYKNVTLFAITGIVILFSEEITIFCELKMEITIINMLGKLKNIKTTKNFRSIFL